MNNTYIEIDSARFIKNLQSISNWINKDRSGEEQKVKICLPVKANAYGHGLVQMSKIAEDFVDYLAVSCLDEGVQLRQNGIKKPILVFGGFSNGQANDLIINNLELTITSLPSAKFVDELCSQSNLSCNVHVKVDTGMNRVGVRPDDAMELINYVRDSKWMKLVGVYSHLASSDKPDDDTTKLQISQFSKVVKHVRKVNPEIICHLANSGGICYYQDSFFDMVRPGIFSYGYTPGWRAVDDLLNQVQPCFSVKSQVIYFKVVAKNSGISYNHRYITPIQTRIVTIPIGYGDGYRRILSNCGEVLIGGHKYTVAGTVCMDMIMVDIGPEAAVNIGDEAVLIGSQGSNEISLNSVAKKCNTITYEILCGFSERLPRVYI